MAGSGDGRYAMEKCVAENESDVSCVRRYAVDVCAARSDMDISRSTVRSQAKENWMRRHATEYGERYSKILYIGASLSGFSGGYETPSFWNIASSVLNATGLTQLGILMIRSC